MKTIKLLKNKGKYLTQLRTTMKNFICRKKHEFSSKKYIFDTKLDQILNDKEKLDCDGEVTDTECSEAIGNMKLNKSPGLNGLTVEF